jgi:hypothetical protein
VIEIVLDRLSPPAEERPGLRLFLSDLLETDPEITDELKGLLNVKNGD